MTSNALKAKELAEQARHNKAEEEIKAKQTAIKEGELEQLTKKTDYSDPRRPYNAVNQGVSHGVNLFGSLSKALNDFTFYTYYKDLVMNVLKQAIRAKAGVGVIDPMDDTFYQSDYPVLPGEVHMNKNSIMYFEFVPSLGNCNGQESPTSIATRDFNNAVRSKNSGSTNYDGADLFQFPLAVDSAYFTLAWLLRGLSLVNFVNPREPFTVAYQLLQAHCFNDSNLVNDFINNKNDLISIYNSAVTRLNVLNVPFELSYIKRHVFLTQSLFYNGEHVGRSYYLVNPQVYFVYDETNSQLKHESFYTNIRLNGLVEGFRRVMNRIILPLELSQTISTMSGDIEKAGFKCVTLPTIPLESGDKLLPNLVNDIKYLQSFKNADIATINDLDEIDIKQGIDASGNPFLYQGVYSGVYWRGPEVTWASADFVAGDGSYKRNDDIIMPQVAPKLVVDYYDEKSITEEDQCYNFAFKFTVSRDSSLLYIDHARSEIIVLFQQYRFDLSSGTLITEVDQGTNVLGFDVDFTGTVQSNANRLHQRCHAANLLAMTDFVPRFYLPIAVVNPDNSLTNYCEIIWNRNRNRNYVDSALAGDILDYTLRSMFAINTPKSNQDYQGTSNKGNNSKPKKK